MALLQNQSKPGPYAQPQAMPLANGSKPGPYVANTPYGYPSSQTKPEMGFGPADPRQQLQERGQERVPFRPNNGNPRGANNMPSRIPLGMGRQQPQTEEEVNALREQNRRLRGQGLNPYEFQSPGANPSQGSNPYQGFMDFYNRQRPGGGGYTDPFGQQMGPNPPGQGGGGNPYMSNPNFYQFGGYVNAPSGHNRGPSQGYMGGQSQNSGRYRPPMMNGNSWQDYGGYNYNLPNAFGSYPGYGQGDPYSQYYGSGYGGLYGGWG